jgi:aldehyde dehydrogenase (NAD+)
MHHLTIAQIFEDQGKNRWNCATSSASDRKKKLSGLRDILESKREAILGAMAEDLRRHPMESELMEFTPTVAELDHAVAHLDYWMEPQPRPTPLALAPASSHVRFEAQGRVLVIGAWNYPFYLSVVPAIAALAAGNTVILKPSELAPATSRVLKEIFDIAFEVHDAAVVEGGVEVSQEILKLPFDHFFYTGGGAVGKIVMKAAAEHLAKVTLELGGKSPVILDESASLSQAGKRIAWGKFVNSGQTCIAPDYVLVPRGQESELISAIRAQVESSYGGDEESRKKTPDLARIVNTRHFHRIREMVEKSVEQGARVEMGGRFDESEKYIAPTVLSGVKADHAIMSDEIFGPVLPVISVDSLDEAISFVRSRPKPLALYVFSKRGDRTERILRETTSGGVTVNDCMLHIANPDLPFGGVGASGLGSYHGRSGFQCFSHERAVLMQAPVSAVGWFTPPYTQRLKGLIGVMKKLL